MLKRLKMWRIVSIILVSNVMLASVFSAEQQTREELNQKCKRIETILTNVGMLTNEGLLPSVVYWPREDTAKRAQEITECDLQKIKKEEISNILEESKKILSYYRDACVDLTTRQLANHQAHPSLKLILESAFANTPTDAIHSQIKDILGWH